MHIARLLTSLGLATLPLVSSACMTDSQFADISIGASCDPAFRREDCKTYAWAAAVAVVNDPDGSWTEPDLDLGAEIVFLANRELRKRGMREVVTDPDVLLMYAVGVDMKSLDVIVESSGAKERVAEVPEGAVALLMIDPQSRRVLWVGSATANLLEDPSMDLTRRRIDYAITHIFEQ